MSYLDSFVPQHEYLICVDSDGCVMDTMNCKHFHCFGPSLVAQWELEPWSDAVLRRWTDINLMEMTRGINRFRALSIALKEIDAKYKRIPGLQALCDWVQTHVTLSNETLAEHLETVEDLLQRQCLAKALQWSVTVNEEITKLPDGLKKPFDGVRQALSAAARYADIAVVSGANREAVEEEWERHGLLPYANVILAQDCGSVQRCLERLVEMGYQPEHVLMVGDAPEDLDAARSTGVCFYSIMVNWEEESWDAFTVEALPRFALRQYEAYQLERIQIFIENLGGSV